MLGHVEARQNSRSAGPGPQLRARRYSVLFISQEMPVSQLMHRHTAAMGSVDLGRILRADASDSGMWECVNEAARRLGELNLVHDDQSRRACWTSAAKRCRSNGSTGWTCCSLTSCSDAGRWRRQPKPGT